MSQSINIALVGAIGSVGETLVELLEERDFPVGELHLLADGESVGQSLSFRGRQVRVRSLEAFDFAQVRLAFFAAGAEVTRAQAGRVSAAGCSLIDLGAALPLVQAPCVLPEAGLGGLQSLRAPFLISSPTPSAVAVALVLAALRPLFQPSRLQLTAMLAVSTLGRAGGAGAGAANCRVAQRSPVGAQGVGSADRLQPTGTGRRAGRAGALRAGAASGK